MATAIQGAVILDQDGQRVRYKNKCEQCGTVQPGANSTSVGTGTLNTAFKCVKCGNMQKVAIKG